MILLQLFDEVDTEVYSVGLEINEIQATPGGGGVQFSCEID